MITLNDKTRKEIAFNFGAKLEVRYYGATNACGCWISYGGEGYPREDDEDIRINDKEKYVVLDSITTGLTYGIFNSACVTRFIKPYFTGNFNSCLDWVMKNTVWTDENTKIFEQNFCIHPENTKHTEDNSKLYVKLEDDTCIVYKDEIGVYHIESVHKLITDEDYKRVYTGSYKECQAFIAGATVSFSKDWFIVIDEFGYEILCGEREPNTLVVYEGTSQECSDFTKGFKSWEKVLASFVKTLEERNIPVDIHELTIRHLKILAKCISGMKINKKEIKNCPILNLLVKHRFMGSKSINLEEL